MVCIRQGPRAVNDHYLLILAYFRVVHELPGLFTFNNEDCDWDRLEGELPAAGLAQVLRRLLARKITGQTAKKLLAIKARGDKREIDLIIDEGDMSLREVSREDYVAMAKALIEANLDMAQKVRRGQSGKLMWFVGQMMKQGRGNIEAEKAKFVLEEILGCETEDL